MKKNDKINDTRLLAKYEGLYLYYIVYEKIYSIDDEDIQFVKGYGYDLIVNPDHTYQT